MSPPQPSHTIRRAMVHTLSLPVGALIVSSPTFPHNTAGHGSHTVITSRSPDCLPPTFPHNTAGHGSHTVITSRSPDCLLPPALIVSPQPSLTIRRAMVHTLSLPVGALIVPSPTFPHNTAGHGSHTVITSRSPDCPLPNLPSQYGGPWFTHCHYQ